MPVPPHGCWQPVELVVLLEECVTDPGEVICVRDVSKCSKER